MRPVGPAALVEWGSLPAVGILVIPLDRFNASLPTEGSDQGDVHDFPPATRHNKHGDTRGVWMPGHRVGVGDLNFAAVRHANVERLERPLILGFLEFVDLHFPPSFDSSPRRVLVLPPLASCSSIRIAAGEAATAVVFILDVDHDHCTGRLRSAVDRVGV